MADIVDIVDEPSEFDVVSQEIDKKSEPVSEVLPPELPTKYQGKKLEDIVKMHQEAERKIGEQGQEIGDVRKLADELLRQQLTKKAEAEKPVEIDFFTDPLGAVKQAIASDPEVLASKQFAEQTRKAQALQAVQQKHPDMESVVREQDFVNFVNASPERIAQFNRASNFDANAGIEILNNYKLEKDYRAIKSAHVETVVSEGEKQVRDKAMNAASVDTSGTNESTKKIYRSADLIKLRIRDPSRYEAMADSGELAKAYEEGRVR